MAGPKITVIGAGSYFFGKEIIRRMATSPILAGGTLALIDTDAKVLATMLRLAERVITAHHGDVRLMGSTERQDVLEGSDFVVLTFSHRNTHYRRIDTEISARFGIRMCSSDTIGPGGIFRSLRELPTVMEVAADVQRFSPDAWVIDLVNPVGVIGMALRRYAPTVRSFALCDGNHTAFNTLQLCRMTGIVPPDAATVPSRVMRNLDIRIGGVNHCTWLIRFSHEEKDMMPALLSQLREREREEELAPSPIAKYRYNYRYARELYDIYGAYPTVVIHTKEYVPFFQGYGVNPVAPEPIQLFDADEREREMTTAWDRIERCVSDELDPSELFAVVRDEMPCEIIESMWRGTGAQFYVNCPNGGSVDNLAPNAFLELLCDVDRHGPRPRPFGPMPGGILALQQQVLDTHELTAEAALTGDRAVLKRAMLVDPLCNNIADAQQCMEQLLEAEREALPAYWFPRG